MAVLLGEASLSDVGYVVTLKDDLVLRRLVWGREQKNDNGHRVLEACSLFANLGVDGAAKIELEFVASAICKIPWQECFEWITRFEKRQLIQRRGDPALRRFLVELTRFVTIGEREISRIVPHVRSGDIAPQDVRALAYGAVLEPLSTAQIDPLIQALHDRGPAGVWTALDIVSMYLYAHKGRSSALKDRILDLLMTKGLLSQDASSVSDDHHFEILAKIILEDESLGRGLARHLASEIVGMCRLDSFPYNRDHLITELMKILFSRHVREAWPAFREAIEEDNPLTQFHLEHVLGSGFDKGEGKKGALLTYSDDELLAWCRRRTSSTRQSAIRSKILASSSHNSTTTLLPVFDAPERSAVAVYGKKVKYEVTNRDISIQPCILLE